MAIELVRKKDNPSLKDLFDLHRKQIFLDLNCHAIATVKAFDATKQTVTATINYPKTYFEKDAQGNYQPVPVPYPILVDVPVVVLGGGNSHLTLPIGEGDQCLILFNDRDMDNWYRGGKNAELATNRMHSMSDGLALVGLHSLANPIDNYDTTRAVLRNGEAGVGVSTTKIKIYNTTSSLGPVLTTLINSLITFGNAIAGAADPTVAGAGTALAASATSTLTQIQGLLE